MKPRIILLTAFAFFLSACAAQPTPQVTVEATATLQPTATATVTATPTASATPTPAETKLTVADLADTSKFVVMESGGYGLLIDGVAAPDMNYWSDGKGMTLSYGGKELYFSSEDVKIKADGLVTMGPIERSASGEVTLIPGCTAEQLLAGESCGPGVKIVWEKGNDNHLKFAETVTILRDLLMGEDIPEAAERAVASGYSYSRAGRKYHPEGLLHVTPNVAGDSVVGWDEKPIGISFEEQAIFPVTIIDKRDLDSIEVIEAIHIPLIANEPEGAFGMSALVPKDLGKSKDFLDRKDLDRLLLWLVKGSRENLHQAFVANSGLIDIVAEVNRLSFFQDVPTAEWDDAGWQVNVNRLPNSARKAFFTLLVSSY